MKQIVFLLVCILLAGVLFAQDIKTLFAFKNHIAMGNIPRFPKSPDTANGGQQREIPVLPKFNYHLFVMATNTKQPLITKLVLGGKPVKFRIEKIINYPVYYTYYNGRTEQKITMVDAKQKNVYQLVVTEYIGVDNTSVIPANKISITYKINGIHKIKSLGIIKDMPSSVVY
jgi:hypothetical protein